MNTAPQWAWRIVGLGDFAGSQDAAERGAETVFFEAATTTEFAGIDARARFRERWFGRYLAHYRDDFLIAVENETLTVLGYLAGCPRNSFAEPAFAQDAAIEPFRKAAARFPSHLHVNIMERARGHGIGAALVETYLAQLARRRIAGVHVVTGSGAGNVGFYTKLRFDPAASARIGTTDLVLLGRSL